MKLTIAAIGRMKAGPMADLVDTYAKRTRQAGRQAGITALNVVDFPESRKTTAPARTAGEAGLLENTIPHGAVLVVLDERGKPVSTAEFADIIKSELESGTQRIQRLQDFQPALSGGRENLVGWQGHQSIGPRL